jgi:hypothetical protein
MARELSAIESEQLVTILSKDDASKRSAAMNRLCERAQKSYSLASVYQAAGR